MKELKCPRCGRSTMVMEGREPNADPVFVCRAVHRCGLRVVVPGGAKWTAQQQQRHVRRTWRTDGYGNA